MKVDEILSRFDEECFQEILGREVIGTLKELGSKYLYAENLLKILKNTFSNIELLSSPIPRNFIIDSLNEEELDELSSLFILEKGISKYEALKRINFKGKELEILFNFFEEELPIKPPIVWTSKSSITPQYPLYSYQKDVLKRMQAIVLSDKNRVLLHMPTGSGKTRTAISYICRYFLEYDNTNVIWFANTQELLEQAFQEFNKAWSYLGDRKIDSVKFWGKTKLDIANVKNSFIIAGLNKTYSAFLKDVESMSIFAANTSLIIMDEAHMAIAPTYKLLLDLMMTQKASLIGLSATPGRTWNDPIEDEKLSKFFFKQKVKLNIEGYSNPVDYLIKEGYLARTKNTKLFHHKGIKLTEEDIQYLRENYKLSESVLKRISQDKLRNMALVSKIEELVTRHKRIILFAITKQHSIVLSALLTALGIESYALTSETSNLDRGEIIAKYKEPIKVISLPIVLCNYGILTTGFDAPETSCAVIARPTDSLVLYSQMVGRAIRGIRSGGNEEAEIVTVIDETLAGFKEVAEAFINWDDVWEDN